MMQRFLFGLVAVPLLASVATAAPPEQLNDRQMDTITAGALLTPISLPCGCVASNFYSFNVGVVAIPPSSASQPTGPTVTTMSGSLSLGANAAFLETLSIFGLP
jgi:hypothetical protein